MPLHGLMYFICLLFSVFFVEHATVHSILNFLLLGQVHFWQSSWFNLFLCLLSSVKETTQRMKSGILLRDKF